MFADLIGYNPHDYAGHFVRRGSSHAFQSRVPVELIKILDDWKSDAVPLKVKLETIKLIFNSLSQ